MGRSGTTLPLALAALSGCVLPRCFALQKTGADMIEMLEKAVTVEKGETAHKARMSPAPPRAKFLPWWTEGSRSEWLNLYDIHLDKDATAIVTHCGKNSQAYIDHAVMLGISLKRHMPDYPRIALGVKGMTDDHKISLEEAGWHVVLVADWRFPASVIDDYNKSGIEHFNINFVAQHEDSMERLNLFRLPIGRVLYLDADTYVASGKLNSLLNGTDGSKVPSGNIGMVQHGCPKMTNVKAKYSAGVMLFKPSLEKYKEMLVKAAQVMVGNATRKNDEQIINEFYDKQVTSLDKKYNCMDPWDVQGPDQCQKRCTEVVVSHFFGAPKPAIADEKFLSFVRKPSGPFEQCFNMNHGSCSAWSNFYCDLVDNRKMLTKPLQLIVKRLGGCCHMPANESDPDDCTAVEEVCPELVSFNNRYKLSKNVNIFKQAPWFGNYTKTTVVVSGKSTLTPDPFYHGGRPIYAGPNGYFLFYGLELKKWMVGKNIKSARAKTGADLVGSWEIDSYAHDHGMHTKCPENTKNWKIPKYQYQGVQSKESTIMVTDLNNGAKVETFESLAMYKKHKRQEYLHAKHLKHKQHLARLQAMGLLPSQDNTTAGEMTPQDNSTIDEKIPEDTAADEAAPEDKTTADQAALEDTSAAGETQKEPEETEDTETKLDAETPQVATADETATADTTTAVEVPKELEESKGPTVDAETPQVATADETAAADTTTAVEVPRELEEAKGPTETKLAAEGSATSSASKMANLQSLPIFKIVLDKTSGRKLGMKVNKNDGVTLEITEVTGDLLEQWNDDNPFLAVKRGDRILEVNGIAKDAQQLSEECKQNKMLELVVKRGQATTADTTRTEDTTTAGDMKELRETMLHKVASQIIESGGDSTTMPNELEKSKGPDETMVRLPTADETATADTTTAVEVPKELVESKGPTVDAETPQVATADETATADTTTAAEMPKELVESKGPAETEPDDETSKGSASQFKMVLDKSTGRKLGMKVNKKNGVTLQVTEVTGDLVEQWNDDHPDLAVYRGDSIVEVNGIANDALKLFEECKKNKMLELVVKRGQDTTEDETDTADTTTAGEMQKELNEVKDPLVTKDDAETPQVTTADETATADTTTAVEVQKELEESKGPTAEAETPQVATADETDTADTTTAVEVPKELEESKGATADAETPQVATSDKSLEDKKSLTDLKKQLETSILRLPNIPEVEAARKALQKQLDDVIARM